MYDDGFESSFPIYQNIENPNELEKLLTPLSNDKGAALFFMLEDIVGKDNLKDSIKVYKNKNIKKNL